MMQRGEVVVIQFPFASGTVTKCRPALVIQTDINNRKLNNTIVAAISSNIRLAKTEPSQLLVDPGTPEGASSGLAHPSAVKCENLFTVAQSEIHRSIGTLPEILMSRIDECLKAALGLT